MIYLNGLNVRFWNMWVNVLGIAEGRDLEAESFNLPQMPIRITND